MALFLGLLQERCCGGTVIRQGDTIIRGHWMVSSDIYSFTQSKLGVILAEQALAVAELAGAAPQAFRRLAAAANVEREACALLCPRESGGGAQQPAALSLLHAPLRHSGGPPPVWTDMHAVVSLHTACICDTEHGAANVDI